MLLFCLIKKNYIVKKSQNSVVKIQKNYIVKKQQQQNTE